MLKIFKNFTLSKKYIESLVSGALLKQRDFSNVRYFCLFIGHGRSGSSLIASLLDAHPNAIIGMEVNILDLINRGFSKKQIFYLILSNSRNYRHVLNNTWSGYSYCIPEQYSGTYTDLFVIGDKKAYQTSKRIGENFSLYNKLKQIIGLPVKFIHVIRNPFDTISTMIIKKRKYNIKPTFNDFLNIAEHYFKNVQINHNLIKMSEFDILNVYHEKLILDSRKNIERILNFLELPFTEDYIKNCMSIIYKYPHKSRYDIDWPENIKQKIQQEINLYPYLRGYAFNS